MMKFIPLLLLMVSCSSFIHWVDRYDRPILEEEKKILPPEGNGDKFCKKCCPCPTEASTNNLPSAIVAPETSEATNVKNIKKKE